MGPGGLLAAITILGPEGILEAMDVGESGRLINPALPKIQRVISSGVVLKAGGLVGPEGLNAGLESAKKVDGGVIGL